MRFILSWRTIALVAVIIFGGALLLKAASVAFRRHSRQFRVLMVVLLGLSILAIASATVLSRSTGYSVRLLISPFWSYRRALSFAGNGAFPWLTITDSRILKLIILNILLYVPLGYLLPFALPQRWRSKRRALYFWSAVLIGLGISIATELTQLVFKLGFFEFDDLFNNTLGCLIGVTVYQLLLKPRIPATERLHESKA